MSISRNKNEIVELATIFTSPIRVAIIEQLLAGTCIVGDLVQALQMEQAVVSKQLGVLRSAGLLDCEPNGRCRSYSLSNPELMKLLFSILKDAAQKAAEHLTSLENADSDNQTPIKDV